MTINDSFPYSHVLLRGESLKASEIKGVMQQSLFQRLPSQNTNVLKTYKTITCVNVLPCVLCFMHSLVLFLEGFREFSAVLLVLQFVLSQFIDYFANKHVCLPNIFVVSVVRSLLHFQHCLSCVENGCRRGQQPFPAHNGQEARYTQDRSQV